MKEVKDFISQRERASKKEAWNLLEMLLTEFNIGFNPKLVLNQAQPSLPYCHNMNPGTGLTLQEEKEGCEMSRTVCKNPMHPRWAPFLWLGTEKDKGSELSRGDRPSSALVRSKWRASKQTWWSSIYLDRKAELVLLNKILRRERKKKNGTIVLLLCVWRVPSRQWTDKKPSQFPNTGKVKTALPAPWAVLEYIGLGDSWASLRIQSQILFGL